MYNLDFINSKYDKIFENVAHEKFMLEKNLAVEEIDNAVLLPYELLPNMGWVGGGGILSGNKYYTQSALNGAGGEPYFFDEKDITHDDREVVFLGMFSYTWGHCLTCNLKHLWFLLDPALKKKYEHLDFVYATWYDSNAKMHDNFMSLLFKLGIDVNNIKKINSITRFKKIHFPDSCFNYDVKSEHYYYTKEFVEIIESIKKNVQTNYSFPNVYYSRTQFVDPIAMKPYQKYRDIGERRIEKVFLNMGYKIISPELLSLDEQIAILKGCSKFATTEGSIAHNSIFLSNKTDVVIIRKADYFNNYQIAINDARNLNVTYIDSHKSVYASSSAGPFFMYVSRNLCRFADIPNIPFPVFSFLFYLLLPKARVIKKKISVVKNKGKHICKKILVNLRIYHFLFKNKK